jgi:hypothetical protein
VEDETPGLENVGHERQYISVGSRVWTETLNEDSERR